MLEEALTTREVPFQTITHLFVNLTYGPVGQQSRDKTTTFEALRLGGNRAFSRSPGFFLLMDDGEVPEPRLGPAGSV